MKLIDAPPTACVGARSESGSGRPRFSLDNSVVALLVFLAVEAAVVVAVPIWTSHQWFAADEWDFLAARKAGSVNDLLNPHVGHLMTIPILVYRGLFGLFGLHTYVPYQAVNLLVHLMTAALLRTIMRRSGVSPWIATAAASLLLVFGAGRSGIISGFGISLGGSLLFGLAQLLLASHDGPIDRRDWLGLLAGVAGLLCSGVAVAMVFVVGMVTLVRRGWRVALFHTLPLVVLLAAWWFGIARRYYASPKIGGHLGQLLAWMETGVSAGFNAMGQLPGAGVALGGLLVVGLVLAWGRLDRHRLVTQAAPPAALLIGAFIFVGLSGWKEVQYGANVASDSHYLHIFVAMALPSMAVAADAFARRWRATFPVALGAFVIGMPGNVQTLASPPDIFSPTFQAHYRQLLLSVPTSPVAHAVPRSARPDPYQGRTLLAAQVTVGWLLDQKAAGRLPDPGPVDSSTKADVALLLALQQHAGRLPISTSLATSSPPLVLATKTKLGTILVDNRGMTLYTPYSNTARPVSCRGACLSIWTPVLAPPGTKTPPAGPGVSGLGTNRSAEITYFGYPLYRYSRDNAPGEINGSMAKTPGGTFHIIRLEAPKTCRPLVAPVTRSLQKGQSIGFDGGPIGITYYGPQGPSHLMRYLAANGNSLIGEMGPLRIRVEPAGHEKVTICM